MMEVGTHLSLSLHVGAGQLLVAWHLQAISVHTTWFPLQPQVLHPSLQLVQLPPAEHLKGEEHLGRLVVVGAVVAGVVGGMSVLVPTPSASGNAINITNALKRVKARRLVSEDMRIECGCSTASGPCNNRFQWSTWNFVTRCSSFRYRNIK